ncbi:magnesium/cobalt transporter CorA [Leptospira wolffii]|uniref:Magnesium transport protein CorA n=1 Tax=Leptospira wolffii TaxID=409998 RepID=A0ABV5BST2_9LEPT|nr:magnesium/cobalt transporter CorA [Leptospira wolffii]TGL51899.1 magnesium/cobalt transporter CorA [Leptospira wolffii]
MLRILFFPQTQEPHKNPTVLQGEINEEFKKEFRLRASAQKEKIWIDIENTGKEDLAFLSENCGFHPLAIEDCINRNQRPKFEDYEDHAFIVLHSFNAEQNKTVIPRETHVFFNLEFIVSVHKHKEILIDNLWNRCLAEPNLTAKGTDHVLYLLFDLLVDSNFPILDRFSDEITRLENQILVNQVKPDFITNILFLKRNLVRMRRVLSPQREVLNLIMRHEDKFLSEKIRFYFRDVYDHLSRLVETIDMDRDLIGNSMDAYYSLISQRTNEIIKNLTLVSMVFMPLTFLTGFFGMNFIALPYSNKYALVASIGMILAIPVGMMLYFRSKKWFNS